MLKLRTIGLLEGLLLLMALSLFLGMGVLFDWHSDGGVAIGESYRILQGEILYDDFNSFWMPVTNWLLTGWMRLWGDSIIAIQILAALIYAGICLNLYTFTQKLTNSHRWAWVGVIAFLIASVFPSVNHNWLGLLATSTIVHLYLRQPQKDRDIVWVSWGLLIGLVATIILWQAGVLLAAFVLLITQFQWQTRVKIRRIIILIMSSMIPLILIGSLFLLQGRFVPWVENAIIFPLSSYLQGHAQIPNSFLILPTLLMYLLLLWRARRMAATLIDQAYLTLLIVGFTYLQFGVLASSHGHIVLCYVFLLPLVCKYIQLNHRSLLQRSEFWVLLIFGVGVFTVGINKVNFIRQNTLQYVHTPQSPLLSSQRYREIFNMMNQHQSEIRPACFIVPWAPELYYLYGVSNPLRNNHFGPEHYQDIVFDEVVNDLKVRDVQCVLYLDSVNMIYPLYPTSVRNYIVQEYSLKYPLLPNSNFPYDGLWIRD